MGSGAAGGGSNSCGWSGSDGSRGGGGLTLSASSIEIDGTVTADGGSGGSGSSNCAAAGGSGGGASGGGIMIDGLDVVITGTISAQGGNGAAGVYSNNKDSGRGEDGGGGRIKVFYSTLSDSSANYYASGYRSGTTYFEQSNVPPNNPSNLQPSGGGANTNPSISAEFNDNDGDSGTLYFETGGGSNIGSCNVNDGNRCSITYSSANNWGTSYTFQVYAQDGSGATSGTVSQSFTTNYRPSVSNLQPSGDAVQVNPTLSADVSDSDGDCMTVTFRDASDNSNIGSDSVCNSGTATYDTSGDAFGSNTGTTYSFDAVVDDGKASVTSSDSTFTTVYRPNAPSNPSPPDGQNDVSTSTNLQVDVSHPDGLSMDVDFYLDDGSGYSNVGSDNGVDDGDTASITPGLDLSGDYSWYTVARASGHSAQSSTWSFQTQHDVYASSISGPSKSPASIDPTLSATVSHSDSAETVTVDFVNADTGNTISGCSISGIGNGQTATCDTSNDNSFGSSPGTTYNWEVQISGDRASESFTSSDRGFTTVGNPNNPSNPNPNNELDVGLGSALPLGEAGRVSGLVGRDVHFPTFNRGFDQTPHVFATTQTTNGGQDPSEAHIRDVNTGSFETQHCEFENTDSCDSHADEVNGFFAVNPNNAEDTPGWDSGIVNVDSGSGSYPINYNMGTQPLLFASPQTDNGEPSLNTRFSSVSSDGANLYFCEQNGQDSCDSSHANEDVAWLALDPSEVSERDGFEYGTFTMSGSSFQSVNFDQNFESPPVVIADVQTRNDGEDAVYAEVDNVGSGGADVRFCESDAGDGCDAHGTEEVAWMAIEPTALSVDVSHPDNLDMNVQFTMDGNNVGSETVNGGSGTASVTPSLGYSEDRSWSVDIDTQGYSTSTSGGTYTFETVHDVYTQSISGPPKSPASINPTLEATVSHSDPNEQVAVNFVNTDTGNTISGCSVSEIGNGQTATCDTSGASFGTNPGTTYNWRVEISGDRASESFTSSQLSFTTISKPDSPSLVNPSPSGTSGIDTANNLRVEVTHPDSENMDVTFRIDDGSGYVTAGTDTGVGSSDVASVNPSLATGESYDWYAEVDTADYTTSNSNAGNPYSFTTNYGPAVDSVSATDSSSGHAFSSVYGIVSDTDGASDISSATLTVDDGDGNTNSYSSTSIDTSAGTSNEANVTFGSVSYTDVAGWSGNENMQLKIQTTDNDGRSALKDTTRKFPNHAPVVETGFSYTDDPNNHAFTLSIEASDVDAGSSEIASCNVEHSDGTNSFSTSGNLITGEPRSTCKLRIDTSFTGYQKGNVISHNVTFTDQHGKSVTSLTDTHMIPNTAPTASNLEPSGSAVQYGPTIKATYNDADGDTGSITFYNSSSGAQIGTTQTGLTDGTVASVTWGSADTPGTEFNFRAEASDGLNSTNSTQNFTTIFQPKKPFDPFPANNSVVDTTNSLNSDVAASVEVEHPDGRDMDVEFINASSGNTIDIDYGVPSGGRAKIDNDQTSLRDETNTTYKWFARSIDPGTDPDQKKLSSIYNFSTVEVGTIDFDFQTGRNENVDITGNADNGNEEIRIGVETSILDVVPEIFVTDSSGNTIKKFTDVSNNSVISVDVVQDGGQDWNLQADQAYEWSIAAYEQPNRVNKIRERGPFNLYTYNISTSWDRSNKYYNVFEYDLYRAKKNGDPPYSYEQVGATADTSYIDAGPELEPGEFCWKVAASNPQGESQRIPSGGICRPLN
jgi:hypothetical protein